MEDVTRFLDEAGVDFDVLEHEHTERAAEEAEALDVALEEVAKTLVLASPGGNVRAEGLSFFSREVGGKKVHLATEDDLARDYAGFELGAVPPFGGPEDRVIVDERLSGRDSVVLEAGSHDTSVRLKAADLVRLTEAQVADITREEPEAG